MTPLYEVEVEMRATVWVDVEAEDEGAAIEAGRDVARLADAQWSEITDASAMLYTQRHA